MTNTIEERTRKVVAGALRAAQETGHEVTAVRVTKDGVTLETQARDIEIVTDPGTVDW